jgi:hypothetical protein
VSTILDRLDRYAPIRIFHNICAPSELLLSSLQQWVISGMTIRDDCQGWRLSEAVPGQLDPHTFMIWGRGAEDTGGWTEGPDAGVFFAGPGDIAVALPVRISVRSLATANERIPHAWKAGSMAQATGVVTTDGCALRHPYEKPVPVTVWIVQFPTSSRHF